MMPTSGRNPAALVVGRDDHMNAASVSVNHDELMKVVSEVWCKSAGAGSVSSGTIAGCCDIPGRRCDRQVGI